jgi:hypothetical protein
MGTKSPLNITEDACAYALSQATELAGMTIYKGQSSSTLELPSIIVSCESLNFPNDIPRGSGNYVAQVKIGVFTSIDGASALANHRNVCQIVMSVMDNVTSVKAGFTNGGDATAYDSLMTSIDTGQGDRAFMTSINYNVTLVLSAV